mgnify:CR=1 FL=1
MSRKNIYKFTFWLIFFVIIVFSFLPGKMLGGMNEPDMKCRIDYIMHFFAFMLLNVMLVLWMGKQKWYIHTIILVACLIFAVVAEYMQMLIPLRAFNPVDILCNFSGSIGGHIISIFTLFGVRKKV